jgi:acyl-CoA thioester hydrolase
MVQLLRFLGGAAAGWQDLITAEVISKTQFYDLDPMKIMWHGNYPRLLEQARCALLDRIGFNYHEMAETRFAWPIVDMRIKYVRPIRFSQEVRVTATLVEYENRLRITYRIVDARSGEVLTKAETVQVAVDMERHEVQFDSPVELLEKVRACL